MTILFSITLILSIAYALFILWCLLGWNLLNEVPAVQQTKPQGTFVSVIIPARNEAENILNCLDGLLRQNYPSHLFELIIVDDHSTDDTANRVEKFMRDHASQQITLIKLADGGSKKM